ncbi:putative feruloyl esterase [Helianthus annuus]|nr:putative feruloyl esterase [Helianthus annuus]
MIHMVDLTSSNLITATRTPSLSDSRFKQRLVVLVNHHPHNLTLNTTTRPIHLKMAAGDSTTANLDQNPGIEQKRIVIQNNHGEKLVGLLHDTGSKEIVVLCHGFQCTKEYSMMVELAFGLEKHGISAFRFDFSGNGESEGIFEFGNYRKEVDDLQAVIQHFTAENRVVSAILGHSKGGNVVVLYASLHHDIHTVVNVSGRYKMDRGIEERLGKDYLERVKKDGFIDIKSKKGESSFRVTKESLMERLHTNMHEAGLKVDQDCKVLTVHGSVDEVIPVEDASEFAKIIPNHELRIIEGANHGYTNHRDELVSVVLNFLKNNMHRA